MRRHTASLAFLASLMIPLYAQEGGQGQGQGQGKDPDRPDAAEHARRDAEAFDDYAKLAKTRKGWRAHIDVSSTVQTVSSLSVPLTTQGTVVVKTVDEKTRWLYWDESLNRAPATAPKPSLEQVSRTLYKGTQYLHTDDKAKVVEKFDFSSKIDFVFVQMLTRDGLTRDWERLFKIDFIANAKYMALSPTHRSLEDLKKMGFKSQEDYDRAMDKIRKITRNPNEEKLYQNKKPKDNGSDEDNLSKYYMVRMTPLDDTIRQDLRVTSVIMKFTPEFIPMLFLLDQGTDGSVAVHFSKRENDVADLPDSLFGLDTAGFTTKEPQKE